MRFLLHLVVLVIALVLVPVSSDARGSVRDTSAREFRVVVSIPPLKGLVEPLFTDAGLKLVGGGADVLIPPGVSEHGYEIPPSKLSGLNRADLVVIVGLGLEPQVEKVLTSRARPQRRVVIAGEALKIGADADKDGHADHEHVHEPGGACCAGHGVDPHVWLDPLLVEKLVSAVAEQVRALVGTDADAARRVWLAEEALIKRVQQVHEEYRAALSGAERRTIVVGHDAWGYLARRYNLTTVPIKGLTATEPTPESMAAATRAVREQGVTSVFVEPQLSQAAGRRIAEAAGATLRTIDPLGSGDWFATMRANLGQIGAALGVPVRERGERGAGEASGYAAPASTPDPRDAAAPGDTTRR